MNVKTLKPGFYGKGSVAVSSKEKVSGEGAVRRLAITSDKLVTQPFEGINTVYDVLAYTARTYGDRRAIGWRDIVDIHEEEKEVTKVVGGKEVKEKKTWKYFQLSDYKYLSFIDVKTRASEISRGLVKLGISSDDVFNIYAQTR
jgi:long-chain acyl-CoA synthetase